MKKKITVFDANKLSPTCWEKNLMANKKGNNLGRTTKLS